MCEACCEALVVVQVSDFLEVKEALELLYHLSLTNSTVSALQKESDPY